eukprot:1187823-Prorocentrum_minimum.AAC.1
MVVAASAGGVNVDERGHPHDGPLLPHLMVVAASAGGVDGDARGHPHDDAERLHERAVLLVGVHHGDHVRHADVDEAARRESLHQPGPRLGGAADQEGQDGAQQGHQRRQQVEPERLRGGAEGVRRGSRGDLTVKCRRL